MDQNQTFLTHTSCLGMKKVVKLDLREFEKVRVMLRCWCEKH